MTEYPRLAAMGVEHPEQISYFSISSLDQIDHLRIVYERPKGSFLPTIRSYRFPRVQKSAKGAGGSTGSDFVMERCPEFREAVAELEKIMSLREIKQDLTAAMLAQLQQLEEDVAMHTDYLKTLIEKIRSI